MYCPGCGAPNEDNNYKCVQCGQLLHPPVPPAPLPPADDDLTARIIPYKNSAALTAYYLGVFSIIPCLGIFLGFPGLFFGLKGLKFAREHPEAHGKTHAWVGIIGGGVLGVGQLLAIVIFLIIAFISSWRQ
jgi:hypothetical protein